MKDHWLISLTLVLTLGWGMFLAVKYLKPKLEQAVSRPPSAADIKSIEDESMRQLKALRFQQQKALIQNLQQQKRIQDQRQEDYINLEIP